MQLDMFPEEVLTEQGSGSVIHCRKCSTDKPEEHFTYSLRNYLSAPRVYGENKFASSTGGMSYCKACRQAYTEGLGKARSSAPPKPTVDYPCDCCKTLVPPEKLHLDHDHKDYKFRGWLCRTCNVSIGGLGDTIEGLNVALDYLRNHYER